LRLGKAGEPDLTSGAPEPWAFGKIRLLRPGRDVCILTYGPIARRAFDLAQRFGERGQTAAIVSVHTLKPLDERGIQSLLREFRQIIVIEESAPSGSLSMKVQALAGATQANCRLDLFTLRDEFIHCYGTYDELLAAHGLDNPTIFARLGL
jgi:transketolase